MSNNHSNTEIERILILFGEQKISRQDATRLLLAVAPNLSRLPAESLEQLLTQLSEHQLSPATVATVLDVPEPNQLRVEKKIERQQRTAKLLRIEIESNDGSEVRLNLPLGLANFALKMIPKEAQKSMSEQGLDVSMLAEMLRHELPDGQLLNLESNDGSEVRIWVE